jgi:hypothetical protein
VGCRAGGGYSRSHGPPTASISASFTGSTSARRASFVDRRPGSSRAPADLGRRARRYDRKRRLRRDRPGGPVWTGAGLRLARRAGHRGLERAHLLLERLLLEKRRRRLVPLALLHRRLGVSPASSGRDPFDPQPVPLSPLSPTRLDLAASARRARHACGAAALSGRTASRARRPWIQGRPASLPIRQAAGPTIGMAGRSARPASAERPTAGQLPGHAGWPEPLSI